MEKFLKHVDEHSTEYGSLPFWSWNDKLDPKELRRQINVMKDLKMNGFFMHARGGLETDYLSGEWYNCINECIDEAEKLGMEAWSYDENGWPSGFAGGKVLEDRANWATYLVKESSKEFPTESNEDKVLLGVYILDGTAIKRISAPCDADEYIAIYQKFDSSYVDTTDAEITKKFIEFTHEDYKKKVEKGFGTSMPGFFTDEPQYYRYGTPWSNKFPMEFEKAYGYDIFDKLPALFIDCDGDCEYRYDYYTMLHKLFIQNWMKLVYEWCEENGCQVTGHGIEETGIHLQMWCCGGVMPLYEYEHIPGIDYLSRNIGNDMAGKQVGSVAAQLGKKKVLSEMFACCGWDVSPKELKTIAELQYSAGVNLMCQHLYAYSVRGQRKRDYPANYSEHLPWQNAMKEFNEYFNRLGLILSTGKEMVNTLMIHPIHSAYICYKRQEDHVSVWDLHSQFSQATDYFSDNQIPYHYGDEELMEKYGSVCGSKLKVGHCEYEYVVLPLTYSLEPSTVKLLKEFIANGGKVYLYGNAPTRIGGRIADMSWLKSNTTFEEIRANANVIMTDDGKACYGVKCMTRDTEFGKIYYIVNVSQNDYKDIEITFNGVKAVKEVKLESCDWNVAPYADVEACTIDGKLTVCTSLEASQSRMFIEVNEAEIIKGYDRWDNTCVKFTKPSDAVEESIAVCNKVENFKLTKSVENAITLDFAEISYDGVTFEKSRSILLINDMLLRNRFKGDIYLKFRYSVDEIPAILNVAVEPMKYKSFKVNGRDVAFDDGFWLDRSFKRANIADYTVVGENEIVMSFEYYQRDYVYYVLYAGVSESLRNCLSFDTEVESIYLFGDFAVNTSSGTFTPDERRSFCYDGKFSIKKANKDINLSNIVLSGYPFFAGNIEAESEFEYNGGDCEINLDGRFSYADVYVNDKFVKRLIFTYHCDITEFVKEGKNTLKIALCNSNRNLLGPHHFEDPEPYACGPWHFSLENSWADEKCPHFRDRYSFVRFGTDVEIISGSGK